MEWSWWAFGVGVTLGLALMWIAAVLSMLGDRRDPDGDREERWR